MNKINSIISRPTKIFIATLIVFGSAIIGLDMWLEYEEANRDYRPWRFYSIESGDRFTVTRGEEMMPIKLCGVEASGGDAQEYLASTVNLGNGTVILDKVGDEYEAWVMLTENYDAKLVSHISSETNELVEGQIHLNTWMIERGYAKHDRTSSSKCGEPEHLNWAEDIAKSEKLGIWAEK